MYIKKAGFVKRPEIKEVTIDLGTLSNRSTARSIRKNNATTDLNLKTEKLKGSDRYGRPSRLITPSLNTQTAVSIISNHVSLPLTPKHTEGQETTISSTLPKTILSALDKSPEIDSRN